MLWIKDPITEDEHDKHDVPGTVHMMQDTSIESENVQLKQTSKGVILTPQPMDSPNDPLNWPVWRRDIALLALSIHALLVGGMTPILAPVMSTLENEFSKKLTDLTYLVGVFMASMGVGSILFSPVAVICGKRVVYLFSLVVFLGGLLWASNATSYSSLMGARVISGIGASPAESLPSASIAEIYFAHERAYRLGIYTLLLLGGKNLSPLVSAFVANRLQWHWIFWISAIICGFVLICSFFFVHETFWDRTPVPDKRSLEESEKARLARIARDLPTWEEQVGSTGDVSIIPNPNPDQSATTTSTKSSAVEKEAAVDAAAEKRTPFFKNLTIYTGRKTDASPWKVFVRPFVLYCYPSIVYACLMYGSSVVWLSVLAETINSIFKGEPYKFKQTSIGLLYIALFIGGCIGSAIGGKVSDVIVRKMSKRNNGIYEPEFRLVMILPVMLTISPGLMGFGWSSERGDLWIVPAVFMALIGFGTSLASTVSITYTVDCYRFYASESLVSLNLFKNILGLAFSIFVPYFFEACGGKTSYVVYGCVEIFLCLLAIPVYRYGKVMRKKMHDKDLVTRFY